MYPSLSASYPCIVLLYLLVEMTCQLTISQINGTPAVSSRRLRLISSIYILFGQLILEPIPPRNNSTARVQSGSAGNNEENFDQSVCCLGTTARDVDFGESLL